MSEQELKPELKQEMKCPHCGMWIRFFCSHSFKPDSRPTSPEVDKLLEALEGVLYRLETENMIWGEIDTIKDALAAYRKSARSEKEGE